MGELKRNIGSCGENAKKVMAEKPVCSQLFTFRILWLKLYSCNLIEKTDVADSRFGLLSCCKYNPKGFKLGNQLS